MQGVILAAAALVPAIVFFGIASLRRRYDFKSAAWTLVILAISRVVFEFWANGVQDGLIATAQTVGAVLVFAVMVFFLGPKVAGETTMMLAAAIALAQFGLPMAIVIIVGLGGATFVAARRWTKASGEQFKNLGLQSAMDIGVMTRSKPDLSRLPDAQEKESSLRVSTAPWYLLGAVLSAVVMCLIAL